MGGTLTRKGLATRQRIVAGAAELFRARGVAGTSLDDVCEATSTSKSQLFHYFPDGRIQLLAAVAQHEADRVIEDQQPALDQLTSWAAWQAWRDRVVERYRAQGQSCPLAVLTSQLGPGSPEHQEVVVGLFRRWQRNIADGIRGMQASGQIGPSVDADRRAAALLAGLQGGVLIMLATGEIAHLEVALDEGIGALRGTPGTAQDGAGASGAAQDGAGASGAGQDGARASGAGQDGARASGAAQDRAGGPAAPDGRGSPAARDGSRA